ncbi:uncharacterized protein LOC132925306 [Rhopalosiphum padi]|uniref:uncharacterized protein LOC132925306 n=1 Tax=Rhopalosiphum padi TaxID=40932 RepID=UPI00298E8758|nr:uncharacterized protein LOC132925306 [Rhopalosiphum padi]
MANGEKSTSSLASIGFSNWKHISERLKEHELSIPHNTAQEKWIQLRMGLDLHKTVDNNIQDNLNIEKKRWRSILKRIIACIEFLAEHNDAFRGLIQMIAKFDIIMADHLRRVRNDEIHDHYLGPRIQNELISIIATKIRDEIINRVKQNFTLKPMSDTRWESWVESIKPIRFQLCQVHDALVEVLLFGMKSLSGINKVSKSLQSESMELKKMGLSYQKKTAQKLCEDVGTQAVFKQSRVLKKSKQFDYECNDTRTVSNEQKFYQDYFLAVVDQAIVSINQRFEQLSHHSENF